MQGLRVNHAKLIRMLAAYRSAFRSRTCARGLTPASSNFQVPLNQSLVLSRPSRSKNDRTPPPRGCVPQHPCWLCSGIQHGFRWVPLRRVGPCKLVSISVPEVATSHFCEHHSRLAVNRCQVLNCFFPPPSGFHFYHAVVTLVSADVLHSARKLSSFFPSVRAEDDSGQQRYEGRNFPNLRKGKIQPGCARCRLSTT